MKHKLIASFTFVITFFCTASAMASSAFDAAKRKCINAPSSRKASACYKYNKMKKEAGAGSSYSEMAAAKRKCLNASWSKKAVKCYKYKKLKAAAEMAKQTEQVKATEEKKLAEQVEAAAEMAKQATKLKTVIPTIKQIK